MIFLALFILSTLFSYYGVDFIRKNSHKLYILSAGIAVADIALQIYLLNNTIRLQGAMGSLESVLSRGILGTALISVVMYVGALNARWDYSKKIRSIRAELSIIACFFMFPHNAMYAYHSIKSWMRMLNSDSGTLSMPTVLLSVFGIVAVSLLIPLFVTSFKSVRKKMKPAAWKKLQSYSYLFYAMIYGQILTAYLGFENRRNYLTAFCYSLVFLSYAVLRLRKKFSSAKKA